MYGIMNTAHALRFHVCNHFSMKGIVLSIGDRLQPFVRGVLARDLERKMGEPAVGRRTVPMLYAGRDVDDRTGQNLHGRFALLLIPPAAGYADEHLAAALRRMVDVPVVAAARLEGDVGDLHLLLRKGSQVAVAGEVLRIGRIGFADGENHRALERRTRIIARRILGPDILGQPECRPGLGPAGIKSDMGDDFGDFAAGDAVVLRRLEMEGERAVGDALADKRGNRHQTAVAETEFVGSAPHLPEKDVVVERGKFGGKLPQLVAPCRLDNLLLCHNMKC